MTGPDCAHSSGVYPEGCAFPTVNDPVQHRGGHASAEGTMPGEHVQEGGTMYGDHMDGWDWLWMSFAPVVWIILVGVVVYVAVRLANTPRRDR